MTGSESFPAFAQSHPTYTESAGRTIKAPDILRDSSDLPSPAGKRPPVAAHVILASKDSGEEMIAHQGKEEVVLFPYIGKFERYVSGAGAKPRSCFGTIDDPITMMTRDHDYAGNLMAEIRTLSQSYMPPAGACPTFRAFYAGLLEFEQDLHQHIHLENNILFPRAVALEASAA